MAIRHRTLTSELGGGLVGAAQWDEGHDIDTLDLPSQVSEPANPAAGNIAVYGRTVAGRVRPKVREPSGVDYPLQPHVGFRRVTQWHGGNATAAATAFAIIGAMPYTAVASTVQIPAPATSSLLNQSLRSRLLSATTAGSIVSVRANTARAVRGNASNIGGFDFNIRFGLNVMIAGQRVFAGLWSGSSNPAASDWTTETTNAKIGLACNVNTGNWRLIHNAAGSAPTVIDLGATMPVNNTDVMELALHCAPGASGIDYEVTNLTTGAVVFGTLSTNLPANTLFLGPMITMNNGTTASQVGLDFLSAYLETDL